MNDTSTQNTVARRTLLYGSAAVAGAVMLGACAGGDDGGGSDAAGGSNAAKGKGSAKQPLPTPKKFSESPDLAKLVDSGDLPPVEERLPEVPYVVPHKWVERGKYGGSVATMARESDNADGINWFYGSSPMRFLNDGLDVVGGLVETWDQNNDTSEWTLHFRKGLKWSDGEPFTVDDVLFWWEDMLLNPDHEEVPPDECRSGKGTLAKFQKVDDHTLKLIFDAPAPLTAERLATWANGHPDKGPRWAVPKHYAKQFHPKYNKEIGKDWAVPDGLFATKTNLIKNPEFPTLNGWKVARYQEGRQVVWERNPYYYVVSPDGDQLPYLDQILWKVNPETKVGKVEVFQGKVDLQYGQYYDIDLSDVEEIDNNADNAGIERLLIDGGSGTGSLLMFNLDHRDPKYREIFNEPKFRQAVSHAINRKRIQQAVYYKTGYPSTGTLSPKAMEYVINDQGKKVFEQWRDAYVAYDPDKSKKLLDEAGLKENGDGVRTFPDGSEFRLVFNFPANTTDEHKQKNNLVKQDLEAVGLTVVLDPINPDGYGDQWETGKLDVRAEWEVGDGPNHLLYAQWIAACDRQRYVPLRGRWYELRGTKEADRGINQNDPWKSSPPRMKPEAGSAIQQLQQLYDQTKVESEEMNRVKLVWDMIKIHIEHGPFFIGTVANTPRVVVKKTDLKNVPHRENLAQGGMANPHIHPTPGVYDPEIFYWENPDDH